MSNISETPAHAQWHFTAPHIHEIVMCNISNFPTFSWNWSCYFNIDAYLLLIIIIDYRLHSLVIVLLCQPDLDNQYPLSGRE